jgi:hypothetical protein
MMFNDASGQIPFIDGGDNFYRWLISNATNYDGWTASTSPMMTMSTLVGQYWNWVSYQGLAPTVSLTQPQLSLAFVDDGIAYQPLVQVQCSVHYSNESQPVLTLPNNQLVSTRPDAYTNLAWPIPSNYSNANLSNYFDNIYWTRLPLGEYNNAPSEGLIFVLMDEYEHKATVPCSLLAHWVPSDISIYPKTDRNIHDDPNSNPITIVNRSDIDLSPSAELTFSDEWWALLIPSGSTPMEDILHGISMGAGDDGLQLYHADSQGLAYRISSMVGLFFADALARYASNGTKNMIFQDPRNGSQPFAQDLGYFQLPHEPPPDGYSSWIEYAEANSDTWREVTMSVKRYGYAWSFSGVLTKFAGLALLAQSILAIAHVALVLFGRWSSSAWDSIGNMLALALRSRSPAVPPDHRTGDEKKETWAETVSVRLVENDLELMFNPLRAETLRLMQR